MKKILLIDNGGTVSMKRIEGALRPVDGMEDIKRSIFELKSAIDLSYVKVNQIDSSNLAPPHMKKVFDAVVENYGDYDGFVVLTGTDTLAYLASFLSFWLHGIRRPVIVTGSQKPLGMLGSDAPGNIYYSILFACENIPEVAVFFGKRLYRGNRVTKVDSEDFEAFESPNYLPIGHVNALRHVIRGPLESLLNRPQEENFSYGWSDKVHIIALYPGFNPEFLQQLPSMGYRGVIIEAFGMGNLPNEGEYSLEEAIGKIVEEGMLVAVTSRCLRGSVSVQYETARTYERLKVLFLRDITKEAAYAKMSFLLSQNKDLEWVRENMNNSRDGEMSRKIRE